MPIPKPTKSEKKSEFLSKCAGDKVMNKEYPDTKQRIAICYSQWENKKKTASAVVQGDNDEVIFYTEEN